MGTNLNLLHLLPVVLLLPLLTSANIHHELFLVPPEPLILDYHNGTLLTGNFSVNIVWYGNFTTVQRGIIVDFISSLSASTAAVPSVASWWNTTSLYQGGGALVALGAQYFDTDLSLGNSLTLANLTQLATNNGPHNNSVTVIFTAPDILVESFCLATCGIHRWATTGERNETKFAYIWAGNSETQCPGSCAWPFHKPVYGPQNPPLIPPNGDVGMDGLIIRLSTLLAGTFTNPYGDGYFQGDKLAPLEAISACPGTFGTGYHAGYPGTVLVDNSTGASYNAYGLADRKYLVPGMWNPTTKQCTPLV